MELISKLLLLRKVKNNLGILGYSSEDIQTILETKDFVDLSYKQSKEIKNQSIEFINAINEVVKHFLQISTARRISLNNYEGKISVDTLKILFKILGTNKTLQELDLSNDEINDEQIRDLFKSLHENTSLHKLDLSNNFIGGIGIQILSEALKVNKPPLKSLNLFGNFIDSDDIKTLSDALKVNTTLEELDLGDDDIDNTGAEYLSEVLDVNHVLTTLKLNQNCIDHMWKLKLSMRLRNSSQLTIEDQKDSCYKPYGTYYYY